MNNPGLFHIGERIFKNLDFKTQSNCRLVRRSWNDMIENIAAKAKIELAMMLKSMTKPDIPNANISFSLKYSIKSKRYNHAKWLNFVKTLFAETDDSRMNIYLQKHIKYQNNVEFSTSPLEYFVLVRNLKMVHFILNKKLHDEVSHKYMNSDFELALVNATNANFSEIVECFIPFMSSTHFQEFVFRQTTSGNLNALKILLPNPKEPLIVDRHGNNLIHIAASTSTNDHIEIVKYFIENTEAIIAQNKRGYTPLYFAFCFDNQKAIEILAEAIPEDHILKRIGDKMSIIHFAALKGQFEIVKTLCQKVKNPIVPDYKGNSPIHYAAFNGHVEMLKFLTSYNASLDVQNLDGERPIQLAKLNDHSEAVKYLQECKARFQKQ